MAAFFCFPPSLSSLSTNTIPKLSAASSFSNTRCFFPHKAPCLSHFVARAYNWGDSEYNDDDDGKYTKEDYDSIEIEIVKTGTNSRRIRSKVRIQASLEAVWDILTDYEGLADFIPGLAVSKLLEKTDNFVRLFQIGQQNLAFGLKFDAKGTIDCVEKDLEILPFGQRRDIEFEMVEGDFQLFEGKWSVEQVKSSAGDMQSDSVYDVEYQTTLVYVVNVKPKVWLPVRLVEGRLCTEIRTNLSCIREEAEKAFQSADSVTIED
ncbi:hypothetical protein SASPL_114699 [Salvia splendens]|uniref:Coenzyme Q-binding protein COQ10 START domain-containing protein n=1 Tax=Salvia splendens TaxID=180675 RepID=A0A8X8Y483_SALSN|nr:uncharacterized protein LOC121804878 [Salvia splendens]XP_042060514.1 uncharacterized protein LOC121804878 [Salvia splendens]KAG6424284.1 hypothetical protein SASPL_114699 [Salvia splendens]